MKTLFTLFVLFFATSYCYPQGGWVLQNTGTSLDFVSISCPDNQNCWAIGMLSKWIGPGSYSDSTIVLHTSNGGNLWEIQYNKNMYYYFDPKISGKLIDFYDNNNGCFIGSFNSYSTTNGGKYWVPNDILPDSMNGAPSYKLKYVNNNTICGMTDYTINSSTDKGSTWANSSYLDMDLNGIYFLDSLNGWALGNRNYKYSLMHTSDGGKNWVSQNDTSTLFGGLDMVFTDKNTGWICGYFGKLIKTTDGGITWNKNKFIDSILGLFQILFTDKYHGWILGQQLGWQDVITSAFWTINGGEDWFKDNSFPKETINAIEFTDSVNGWAVGRHGHIWHTTTGGVSFVNDNSVNAIDPFITISPNPAQDLVSAKCNVPIPANTKIELYSSEGLLIRDLKDANFIGKEQFQFSVEELPTGIYFLKMSFSGGVRAYPVCVMK